MLTIGDQAKCTFFINPNKHFENDYFKGVDRDWYWTVHRGVLYNFAHRPCRELIIRADHSASLNGHDFDKLVMK